MTRALSLLTAVGLLLFTVPSEGPDASVTVKGYTDVPVLRGAPQFVSGPVESHPADRKVPLGGAPTRGAPLASPSLPAAVVVPTSVVGQPSRARESAPVTLSGFATWCGPTPTQCQQWGGDAMLGAVPGFRYGDEPYRVTVSREGREPVTVLVVSFCACRDRHGEPTLIDLSPRAFEQLAPLSRGVVRVELARHPDDLRMMLEVRGDELYRP